MKILTREEKLAVIWKFYPYLRNVDVYDPKYGFSPNGCGPDNWHSPLVFDLLNRAWGVGDMSWVGDFHDTLCALGGTQADFAFAASALFDAIRNHLVQVTWNPLTWLNKWFVDGRADAYFLAIKVAGRDHFNWRADPVNACRFMDPVSDCLRVMSIPVIKPCV